jgi:MFS transporter, ACS family, tartrate transporter
MGLIKDLTGSYTGGLLSLSAAGFIAAIIVIALGHDHSLERVPASAPSVE